MPMRIASVDAFPLRRRLREPLLDARSRIVNRTALLVRVREESGRIGWGEAASFGEVEALVGAAVEHLAPLVVGEAAAPRAVAAKLRQGTAHFGQRGVVVAAISGIELALWDLLAKAAGLSVAKLLGGDGGGVRAYATTAFYRDDDDPVTAVARLEEELRGVLADPRFSGAKIKVGRFGVEDDVRRIEAAREVLGQERVLIADANNAWAPADALWVAEAVREVRPLFLEEPIAFGHPGLSARLRARSPVAIGGYELEPTFEGLLPYVEGQAVDFIQPDATWGGGLGSALAIAELAVRQGIAVVPHNFSTSVALAANCTLVSLAGGDLIEVGATGEDPLSALSSPTLRWRVDGGRLEQGEAAGFGIEPDQSWLEELGSR
jgi:L-alanine-DL-glutamate epimerase-like enolase superfamily enzyme